ncbi:NrdH-redoxin [Candidatus Woesearchaeota archaeon]|jgi:glutaredoxin 3|nr:NrdH-redoxin [Candidatus Woesearchaeota archaeon]
MNVNLYVVPTCLWCKKARNFLKKKKIPFEELDINEESQYREEILEKTSQMAVPVIEIDGEIIIGYKEQEINELIKKTKANNKLEEDI